MKRIVKIALAGEPSAKKAEALRRLQGALSKTGYTVLLVPDAAQTLLRGGCAPARFKKSADFYTSKMCMQIALERAFEDAARKTAEDKTLIVCDGGVMDNRAHMTRREFARALRQARASEVALRDGYDAVFLFAAPSRGETADQAPQGDSAALNDALIAAWTGQPHLRVIPPCSGFEEAARHLCEEIVAFLGAPDPFEIERKFLIRYPDLAWLESEPLCRRVEIVQTYLTGQNGEEFRLRRRGEKGDYLYYKTVKHAISALRRVEIERHLSLSEYQSLLASAGKSRRALRKARYCLMYDDQYFEIDVYPFWKDRAILEIELGSEDDPIRFPPQIQILREVTQDMRYRNAALATSRGRKAASSEQIPPLS